MIDPSHPSRRRWKALLALAVLALAIAAVAVRNRSELTAIYAGLGRPRPDPAPVLTPERALRSFQTAEPLRVELAAAEPLVEAPIAGQFDEDGRMWVVEMPTYMPDLAATGERRPGSRIVVLEDVDGDGLFDRRTVFLDHLVLPRAVAPCFGGALVLEPPNLYFCPDADRDTKADEKRLILAGLGAGENPEHAGNGLIRGLDNWYHLSQDRTEFRFDGRTVQTRATPAHGQWGLGQDDFGRLYYTPNSNPLLTDLYPKHYAARNPAQGGAPGIGEDICKDTAVWPSHPTPGVNRGYLENFLRPDGTLAAVTAACGTVVYRAGGLGEAARGNVFICDASANIVKRLILRETDGVPRAENAYKGTEFLRSADERFRPVNLTVGPDGALYVLDMYRGLIQHKTYVTPFLAKQVRERGLETPLVLGRIFRISGDPSLLRQTRKLSNATDAELVTLLSDADGWWRDSAQRLLMERRAVGAAAAVRTLMTRSVSPSVAVSALWTLEGLGQLTEMDVLTAMGSASPEVRCSACRIAEPFLPNPGIGQRIEALCEDRDRAVRLHAAAALGSLDGPPEALIRVLVEQGGDRYFRGAAISGLAGREAGALGLLLRGYQWRGEEARRAAMTDLTDCALRGNDESRANLAELIGEFAAKFDPRVDLLLARVRRVQRLDSDEPRPLKLSREPTAWLAAGQSKSPQAALLAESADYLDWPDRPPVARKFKVRELTAPEWARFARGRELYTACQGCHQPDGTGSVGMAPPLGGSSIVQGPPGHLARVLLHGMEGPYMMAEMEFTGVMVPAPFTSDEEIAAVMTFIRRSWGNTADPVDAAFVARTRSADAGRAKPWTRPEIEEKK